MDPFGIFYHPFCSKKSKNFINFTASKNTRRDTFKTRKPLFPWKQLETTKYIFLNRKPLKKQTGGDRPKSAAYPRLKNSKRTSKCQFTVLENRKTKKSRPSGASGPANASPWRAKRGDTSEIVNISVAVEGGPLAKKQICEKKSHNAEKQKAGTLRDF